MKRDSGTCTKRFPCGLRDPACLSGAGKCKCTCQKALCYSWYKDFKRAMQEVSQVEACVAWRPPRT